MTSIALSLGLFAGGALGFLMGAKPEVVLCLHPEARKQAAHRAAAAVELLYPLAAAFFAGFVFSTLVPDALMHSRGTLAAFAAGVVTMALLSKLVLKRDPCCEGGHDHRGLGAVSLAAMAVCSINDGLLLGLLQPAWNSGLNLGMLLHKITSSFAIAQILIRSGHRGSGLAAFGIAYVLVSPAALLATDLPWAHSLPGGEIVMGFSAGLLAYVTLASLAPHAGGILRRRPKAIFGFAAALLISLGIGFWHRALHGHGHPSDGPSAGVPAGVPAEASTGVSAGADVAGQPSGQRP